MAPTTSNSQSLALTTENDAILRLFDGKELKNFFYWENQNIEEPISFMNFPPEIVREILDRARPQVIIMACQSSKEILKCLRRHRLYSGPFEVDFSKGRIDLEEKCWFVWQAKYAETQLQDTMDCLAFLRSIFLGKVEILKTSASEMTVLNKLPELLKEVKSLEYCSEDPHENEPGIEVVQDFLEKFTNLNELKGARPEWKGEKLYNVDHVTVLEAQWMEPEDLRNLQNKTIRIHNHNFELATVREFISDWIEGKYPNLEMLAIEKKETWLTVELLEGIDYKYYKPENRHDTFYMRDCKPTLENCSMYSYPMTHGCRESGSDMRDAVDIERTVDGEKILATVLVGAQEIIMLVWSDPYPIKQYFPEFEAEFDELTLRVQEGRYRDEEHMYQLRLRATRIKGNMREWKKTIPGEDWKKYERAVTDVY